MASLESSGAAMPLMERDAAMQFTRTLGFNSAARDTVSPGVQGRVRVRVGGVRPSKLEQGMEGRGCKGHREAWKQPRRKE